MNVEDGTVIASTHRRHRATEFKKFLTKIDKNVPDHLDVHVVCDNYGTHKHPTVNTWLGNHPRFHMHFTPTYSSWINQVERLFAEVTRDLLQRSDHRSVQILEKDLRRALPQLQPVSFIDADGQRADVPTDGLRIPRDRTLFGLYQQMVQGRRFEAQVTHPTKQGRLATYPSAAGAQCQAVWSQSRR